MRDVSQPQITIGKNQSSGIQLTLAEYLNYEEYATTHVLISSNGEWPHEEYHPICAAYLAIMREVWTQSYYVYQNMRAARGKKAKVILMSKKKGA